MRAVDNQYTYSLSFEHSNDLLTFNELCYLYLEVDKELEKECRMRLEENIDDPLYEDYAHELFKRLAGHIGGLQYNRTPCK
ncbi:hypothetical protein ACFVS2_25975 [Brevibacillus sp. NPDC058079]|uniref:hypothetical protein n=1 Tax=Brevibacillus sp. NPDC058079 TaxID=3346330 RepID=UPI0036F03345